MSTKRFTIIRYIFIALLVTLVIMQFIRIDKTNPAVDDTKDFLNTQQANQEMSMLFQDACYDCHSHQTHYPWYTNFAPLSWWIEDHIEHGRKHLNFSTWTDYEVKKQHHKLEETVEMLESHEMPLKSFTYTHPEARLTDAQRESMISWTKSLMQGLESKMN